MHQIGFDKQDLIISNYIEEKGKPFILAINKWDIIKDKKNSKNEILDKFLNLYLNLAEHPLSLFLLKMARNRRINGNCFTNL